MFQIKTDMENYVKYRLVGGRIKLKKGVVPRKFECQKPINVKPKRSAIHKRNIHIQCTKLLLSFSLQFKAQ